MTQGVCETCGDFASGRTATSLVDGTVRHIQEFELTRNGPLSAEHHEFCSYGCLVKWIVDTLESQRDHWFQRVDHFPKERRRWWWPL